jgi:hypothetical protein
VFLARNAADNLSITLARQCLAGRGDRACKPAAAGRYGRHWWVCFDRPATLQRLPR